MENKIEISMSAYGALLANQHNVKDTMVTDEGTGWTRTTCQVHDMLLTVVTNYQGSQPITQFYLTDINA